MLEYIMALYSKIDWEFVAWCLAGYAFASEYIGASKYFKNSTVIQYIIGPLKAIVEKVKSYIDVLLKKP